MACCCVGRLRGLLPNGLNGFLALTSTAAGADASVVGSPRDVLAALPSLLDCAFECAGSALGAACRLSSKSSSASTVRVVMCHAA